MQSDHRGLSKSKEAFDTETDGDSEYSSDSGSSVLIEFTDRKKLTKEEIREMRKVCLWSSPCWISESKEDPCNHVAFMSYNTDLSPLYLSVALP